MLSSSFRVGRSGERTSSSGTVAKHFFSKSIGSIEKQIQRPDRMKKEKGDVTYAMVQHESAYDEAVLR